MRGAPGVVRVQENPKTKTKHITIPQIVLEDVLYTAQDFVLFHKNEHGEWCFRKISEKEKRCIQEAYRAEKRSESA